MTTQQLIAMNLNKLMIPKKSIDVYGSQVVITCHSEDAAIRWYMVLKNFCSLVRGPGQAVEPTRDTEFLPNMRDYNHVWRVWGTI